MVGLFSILDEFMETKYRQDEMDESVIGVVTENHIEGTTCMDETVHVEGNLTVLHERTKQRLAQK